MPFLSPVFLHVELLEYLNLICYHLLSFVADSMKFAKHGKILYICSIMKNDYDIEKQKQDDLINAYNQVAPHCLMQDDAYRKAVKQPAPRYYISAKQAAQVLSPMVRGDFTRVDMMIPNRRRMYYSLFEKVLELSEKRAFVGKSLLYITRFAVLSPAPEFFIGGDSFRVLRSYLKNGHYDDDGRTCGLPGRQRAYEKLKRKRERIKALKSSLRS